MSMRARVPVLMLGSQRGWTSCPGVLADRVV
jgi:hypothetical protein